MAPTLTPRDERLTTHHDTLRGDLVEAALAAFTERPYEDVSFDDIAAAAGVTAETARGQFVTKQDLYVAAIETAVANLVCETRIDTDMEPLERLSRGVDAFLDFVEAHRKPYVAIMRDAVGVDPQVTATIERAREQLRERLFAGLCGDSQTERMRTKLRGWVAGVEAATLDWLEQGSGDRTAFIGAARESLLRAKSGYDFIL